MAHRQLAPSTAVWFVPDPNKKDRIAANVEGRQGGAYRISLPGRQTRIVNRHQLVIRRANPYIG